MLADSGNLFWNGSHAKFAWLKPYLAVLQGFDGQDIAPAKKNSTICHNSDKK